MGSRDERGETSVIAVVLVLALALTSALLIAAVGTLTLDESKDAAEVEESVRVLTEFDSRASMVALEGGDSATMALGGSGRGHVGVSDQGRLRLVLSESDDSQTLLDTSLGTVAYSNGDQRVAYQGGGVWRRTAGASSSVMVSPPEVHYREGTLTLPMIRVVGDDSRLYRASIRKDGRQSVYPTADGSSAVAAGQELRLYVTSDYYRAWGVYFERRIGGEVTVYDGNDTVKVVLTSPTEPFSIGSGIISVGTSDRMAMTGSGQNPTFVDAYDSSLEDSYDEQDTQYTTVRGDGGLKMGGNTKVYGDLSTSGTLVFNGKDNTIDGNAAHGGIDGYDPDKDQNTITGWENDNGTGVSVPIIDGAVNQKVNDICDGSSEPLDDTDATYTNASEPYCREGDLEVANGETLVFDLADGNISLAVEGDIDVKGTIEVKNPGESGTVKLWFGGDRIDMSSAGTVVVDGQRSPAFKLYGSSDTYAKMTSDSTFMGLIYAPSTTEAGGGLEMQDSTLYGSAVVGSVTMRSGSSVHYDKALDGYWFDHDGPTPAQELSYLHVTINEIRVEEG